MRVVLVLLLLGTKNLCRKRTLATFRHLLCVISPTESVEHGEPFLPEPVVLGFILGCSESEGEPLREPLAVNASYACGWIRTTCASAETDDSDDASQS